MSFAVNSGGARFQRSDELYTAFETVKDSNAVSSAIPTKFQPLADEIDAEITPEIERSIVENYLAAIDKSAKLLTCSSCGMKAFQMGSCKYHTVPAEPLHVLRCSEERIIKINMTPEEFRYVSTLLYIYEKNLNLSIYLQKGALLLSYQWRFLQFLRTVP